jgi:sensor histidine kinase regulating citrate/malate metabolism
MYRIDFRNNGNPLPEGLTKENYGEYKKYGGLTGKSGIGGYEVAENIKHYGGDFALIQDNDWVVISIFLPKSRAYERL